MKINATFWITGICIVLFLIQITMPGFTEFGVLDKNKPFEIWRFLTAMFLHGDISHILYNMFALVLFGMVLESILGTRKFLLIYFVSGIIANLISINFYEYSLGASGAIFGIIGAIVILRPNLTVWAFGMPMPMIVAGILWAGVDLIGIFNPSGTANIAHLAGMFIGLLVGALYKNWKEKTIKPYRIVLDEGEVRNWEDNYMR